MKHLTLKKYLLPGIATLAGITIGAHAFAAASAADAAKLGAELSPLGA